MKTPIKFILSFALLLLAAADIAAQELITNVYGRDVQSLNGKWDAIVDLYDQGRKNKIYLNRRPRSIRPIPWTPRLKLCVAITRMSRRVRRCVWTPRSEPRKNVKRLRPR